jgi:single-strand DNA-binding protein
MNGMNKVFLLGNLGADPELRYTAAGIAVLSLRLATNESFFDKNKELQERTEWHTVVVWGSRAEALAKILSKGTTVMVEGSLRTSTYEKDGGKRHKTEIHAREVFLTGKRAAPAGSDVIGVPAEGAASTLAALRMPTFIPPAKKEEMIDELPY